MGGGYMKIERPQEKTAKSNGELIGGLRKRIRVGGSSECMPWDDTMNTALCVSSGGER
jgi:hypothetical protein